jgi:N-acyl-D-aspartate/D-glutamate deacylase
MDAEEAYNLADVLRERGTGIIQVLCELPGKPNPRRDVVEELARRSCRPVLHNILVASDTDPEQHRGVLRWLDEMSSRGLDIWTQAFSFRKPLEINPMNYNNWDSVPIFRKLSAATTKAEKLALVRSREYRQLFEAEYAPTLMGGADRALEHFLLVDAATSHTFKPFEGQFLDAIATQLGRTVAAAFLDILEESEMEVLFCNPSEMSGQVVAEIVRHPRVLAGVSDGGAHSKHGNGGFWSTDMIILLTRETNEFTLEEVHNVLSERNARAACLEGRGSLTVGNFADMMVYNWDELNYDPPMRYETLHDLPGGDWRKVKRAVGVEFVVVNGEITFEHGECTGAAPGAMVASHWGSKKPVAVAAE